MAGEDCYLVKVRTRHPESLGRLLHGRFGAIESIASTRTTIGLQTVQESACLPLGTGDAGRGDA